MRLEEPDTGHAWTVALCACVINGILSGMARMVGLLYVACIDHYQVTREEASVAFTVRNAVRYMAGPLTGILGHTFGVRTVTFWGGVIAASGSALCAFAPDMQWIVFFWGGIHGLGFALANTLFQVVINQYFERHRATASGLVLSGACLGAFILPLAIEGALFEYGLPGCFLLLAGLFLNILPPSIVLKSPPWIEFPQEYQRAKALQAIQEKSKTADIDQSWMCNSILSQKDKLKYYDLQKQSAVCKLFRNIEHDDLPYYQKKGIENPAFEQKEELEKTSYPLPKVSNQPEDKGFSKNKLFAVLCNIPFLYLNLGYLLTSLSLATYFLLFLPVITVIVDYSRDKGIPLGQEKFLIHALTTGDLFGRLAFGWVSDRNYISLPLYMLLNFVLQGIFIAVLPFATTLTIWIVVISLYGITAGIIFTHIPILVHKYVDQDNQSIAIGCVGLISSTATFGLPPLIGYFRDNVGSYDGMFYILAACSVANGFFWLLIPIYEKFRGQVNSGL